MVLVNLLMSIIALVFIEENNLWPYATKRPIFSDEWVTTESCSFIPAGAWIRFVTFAKCKGRSQGSRKRKQIDWDTHKVLKEGGLRLRHRISDMQLSKRFLCRSTGKWSMDFATRAVLPFCAAAIGEPAIAIRKMASLAGSQSHLGQ